MGASRIFWGNRVLWYVVLMVLVCCQNTLADRADVEAFVTRFYLQCLQRDPDSGGLAYWTDQLINQTKTGADVAKGFVFSQEFISRNTTNEQFLTILYEAFFDRAPDQAGYQQWLNQLNSGTGREAVLDGFVYAQEFVNLCQSYGTTAYSDPSDDVEKFVSRFYRLCLNREPDSAGLNSWVSALLDGSKTGADVAGGFVLSQEFINRDTTKTEFLTILYQAFFDRDPDQGGWDQWILQLYRGADRSDVVDGFIYAQEFRNLCQAYGITPFGNLPRSMADLLADFVSRFYRLCLSREPDPPGLSDWVTALQNGTKAGADVANGFVFSLEFMNRNTGNEEFLTILYQAFFNRDPDPGGWNQWIGKLNSGTSRADVLNGFIFAQEFSNLCATYGITPYGGGGDQGTPRFSGFDFTIGEGDFWEFQWDYDKSYWDSFGGGSRTQDSGTFRVSLGAERVVGGKPVYSVLITGKGGGMDYSLAPRWKYLGVFDQKILASTDGQTLVTLFDSRKGAWPGSGFFAEFASTTLSTAAAGTINNDYLSGPAIVIGKSSDKSQCEYFPDYGTICGGDYNESFKEHEYYGEDVGPIGYYKHSSISDMTGMYPWSSSTTIHVGLTASSRQGAVVEDELETEPNDSPKTADALSLGVVVLGFASQYDDGDPLPGSPEVEGNDSWQTPQALSLPSVVDGDILDTDLYATMYFYSTGWYVRYVEDWYRFSVSENSTVAVNLKLPEGSTARILLYLLNDTGESNMGVPMSSNEAQTTSKTLSANLNAGTYLIAVDAFDVPDGDRVPYRLSLSTGSVAPSSPVVEDWYTLSLWDTTALSITLDGIASSANLDLYVVDAQTGELLGTADSSTLGAAEALAGTLDAGEYLIGVDAVSQSSEYILSIE